MSVSKKFKKQDSYSLLLKKVSQKCHALKLFTKNSSDSEDMNESVHSDSLITLISWIASKHLKAFREIYTEDKESHANPKLSTIETSSVGEQAIELLDDLLKGYSHIKLQKFFEDQTIRFLFRHFLPKARKHFCSSSTSPEKRVKYEEALRDFEFNLALSQSNC